MTHSETIPSKPLLMLACLGCEWSGSSKDAVQIDELDRCPFCGEIVSETCDRPTIVAADEFDPNAITK